MQQVMVVQYNYAGDLKQLNEVLKDGWKVISTCPMPASIGGKENHIIFPTCLVIIEKPDTLP